MHAVSAQGSSFSGVFSMLDAMLTTLGRENTFIIDQPLHPAHHIIDISRRGEGDGSFILIRPGKVQSVSLHARKRHELGITFRKETRRRGGGRAYSFAAPILLHVCTVQNSETTS